MPEVNIAAMNAHLAVISRAVSVGTIAVMVLDGASWHASPRLRLPDNIVLLPLPPYAPELNPIENSIWDALRGNSLSHQGGTAIRRSSMPAAAPGTHSYGHASCASLNHTSRISKGQNLEPMV